jgi:hypothetical protein
MESSSKVVYGRKLLSLEKAGAKTNLADGFTASKRLERASSLLYIFFNFQN